MTDTKTKIGCTYGQLTVKVLYTPIPYGLVNVSVEKQ